MTTNQTDRVSDEELDQMILKLERDGMTPKMLSLMRELRELRRAKGEPVAVVDIQRGRGDGGKYALCFTSAGHSLPDDVYNLYTAPPAPVVDADDNFYSWFGREWHEHYQQNQYTTAAKQMLGVMAESAWKAGRAAMLQADGTLTNEDTMQLSGNSEQLEPVSNRDELPATQFKPVSDLYGITSPTGSETSFTFDAIEAVNFIEGGWSVQEYVELERYQEAMIGNSPATPDGWIPVSERMPELGVKVLCFPVEDEPIHASFNGQLWIQDISWSVSDESIDNVISCNVTHWQPLPEAPKEVG